MMCEIEVKDAWFERGLTATGNNHRLYKLLAKLRGGQPITYGAIGGSITEGAQASTSENRYVERFATWLRGKTAGTVKVVNAGIGASNSLFGAFRAGKDLLAMRPDLITIEYAVNDTTNPDIAAAYEALVRQCLTALPDTAVILIFTMNRAGENRQHLHIPVGQHYQLPMLSYRDAVYPEVAAGHFTWEDISPDMVHPNDVGHRMIADLLGRLVDRMAAAPEDPAAALPDYLTARAARYMKTSIVDAPAMNVIRQNGWKQGPHRAGYTGWQSETPGAELEVSFKGTYAAVGYQQFSGDFGRVAVSLDGQPVATLEGYFTKMPNNDWAGGHTVLTILAENLPSGTHTLRFTLLPERHANSGGSKFDIGYLLIAE